MNRRPALTWAIILLSTACASPSASSGPSAQPPPPVIVILEESAFVPPNATTVDGKPTLTIPIGTTVTWTNLDPIEHTATEYLNGFPEPDARFDLTLEPEGSGSHTFDQAGTYEVGCVPHPHMQMLLIVEEPEP